MKKIFFAIIAALFAGIILHAENSAGELSREKMEDDLKFKNASHFMKLGRYEQGLRELNEYIEIYTNGIHRHEAYFYIARIAFDSFEYTRAIKIYRTLYEEFSNTEHGVKAYYQAGLCYRKMGYDARAHEIFSEILSSHSGSEYAYQSRIQIDLLDLLSGK